MKMKTEIESSFIRGSQLAKSSEVWEHQKNLIIEQIKRDDLKTTYDEAIKSLIRLGEWVYLPRKFEPEHGIIIGKPGQGKTLVIYEMIKRLRNRGAKAVINDTKGDYIAKNYAPATDLIFNPMDDRTVRWNIFNDIKAETDLEEKINIDNICKSVIPTADDPTAEYWRASARQVLTSIFHYCRKAGRRTNAYLWEVLNLPPSQLRLRLNEYAESRTALKHIEGDNNQTSGIVSTLSQFTQCFEYLKDLDGDFSLRDFVPKKGGGFLFVSNYAKTRETMKPLLSLFIDLMAGELLSMTDDRDRRLFFILDEFGTLSNMPSIIQLLTLSRSKGGAVFLAIQDLGQIERIYGMEHRKTIVNACGTHLYFAVADAKTAEELSYNIGHAEYLEKTQSLHKQRGTWGEDESMSHQKVKREVVLASELMNLQKFSFIMKMPNYPFISSKVKIHEYGDISEPFIIKKEKPKLIDISVDSINEDEAKNENTDSK